MDQSIQATNTLFSHGSLDGIHTPLIYDSPHPFSHLSPLSVYPGCMPQTTTGALNAEGIRLAAQQDETP